MSELSRYTLAYALLLVGGLVVLRVLVRRDYWEQGRLSVATSFLQALVFFTYGGFPYLYLPRDWPAIHVPPVVHAAGLVLIVAGLAVLLYCMVRLGMLRSVGRGDGKLEQSGLYAISRNPQALACGLYVAGFVLLWPSWYAAGWAVLFIILIHAVIRTEEDHLVKTHGEEYLDYLRRAPRYLWRWPERVRNYGIKTFTGK